MKQSKKVGRHRRAVSLKKRIFIGGTAALLVLFGGTVAYADATGTNLSNLVVSLVDQITGSTQQTATSDISNLSAKYKTATDQAVQQLQNTTQNTIQSYEQQQISNANATLNSYLQQQSQQLNGVANQEVQKGEQSIQSQVNQGVQSIEQQIQTELQSQLVKAQGQGQSNNH
ncbi:hypothetical protein LLE49_09025 [Alicyclobacillus tolerans]|uniref:hypothetical protein n=1 Tax=Alicyclobacillus tolerans TaxID=90970 RepID=UPI001F3A8728|nr:hypothetical protein [Alicyclobacillus tolerans]MCF8564859.1 hypothetical protein [Alicyclobacillus tolerans]